MPLPVNTKVKYPAWDGTTMTITDLTITTKHQSGLPNTTLTMVALSDSTNNNWS